MIICSSSDDETAGRPEVILVSDSPVKSPKKKVPKSDFVKTRYVINKSVVTQT